MSRTNSAGHPPNSLKLELDWRCMTGRLSQFRRNLKTAPSYASPKDLHNTATYCRMGNLRNMRRDRRSTTSGKAIRKV